MNQRRPSMPNSAENKPSTRPCSPISIQWNEMQVCTAASAHGKIYIASRILILRPRRWIRILLAIYILPWALAAVQTCISFHWMLIGEQGLVDGLFSALFGIDGLLWFINC